VHKVKDQKNKGKFFIISSFLVTATDSCKCEGEFCLKNSFCPLLKLSIKGNGKEAGGFLFVITP